MHRRTLYLLTWLAAAMSLGHHLDHVIRHNTVGWPLTEQVNAFTISLVVYPVIAAGLLAYRAGRVGPGFWALVSGGGAIFVGAVHFGPAAVEPPQLILGHYGLPILGWLAFGWLVTFVAVLAITLGLATARDGTAVHLRLLRRDERELVARFFAGLSEESRRRRYLKPMARLSAAMLRRLVEVDGRRRVAVVAEVDGQCVGIASWIALADEPGPAEVAVAVTDRYQGWGIGRLLVEALWPLAVRAGLTCLVYLVDPTNRSALRLLWSLGVELAFCDGLVEGRQYLPRRPLLDASSSSGPAPGGWPCRAGPSTRQLPIRVRTAPWTLPLYGKAHVRGDRPEGRSPTGGRRA